MKLALFPGHNSTLGYHSVRQSNLAGLLCFRTFKSCTITRPPRSAFTRSFCFTNRKSSQSTMSWSTSVLSTISSDTEPTVVISFESGKYVFNAGENIGRAWLSSSQSWRKTKAIFLTSIGTQRGSGLSGVLPYYDSRFTEISW